MVAGLNHKKCHYCGWLYPEDQFVKLKRGRGGRQTVIMCLPCHEARKNTKATQERLDQIIAAKKAAIRRNFNTSYKEKN